MSRHRATSIVNIYGLNYCADHSNGNVYEYSLDILSDNGDPIIKERDTAVIHGGLFGVPDTKLFYDEVEFIIVSGLTETEGTGLGPLAPNNTTSCMPYFIFYKSRHSNHKIAAASDQEDDGKILRYQDGWEAYTPPYFNDSPNGGWFHLADIYDTLNNPGATITNFDTADTGTLEKCSLITWYGNPNCMMDDKIWSDGGSGNNNLYLLQFYFWVNGLRQIAPVNEPVFGACIIPVEGDDYYYILTNAATVTNPNPSTNGVDDKIYRKLVSAANEGINWELVATIPYTDYVPSPSANPLPYGTAYIDASGIAWYTKCLVGTSVGVEYALMRVDLVAGTHAIHESSGTSTGTWSSNQSATFVGTSDYIGVAAPDATQYDMDQTSDSSGSGDVYVYTMGGQDARYDLYARVTHSHSYSYHMNAEVPTDVGGGYYCTEVNPTKDWTQNTSLEWVIKKNGVELRSVKMSEFDDTFHSQWIADPIIPAGSSTVLTGTYSTTHLPVQTYYQRWYIFLHPLTPDEDIYIERRMDREMPYDQTDPPTPQDIITMSICRGQTNAPTVLHTFTASKDVSFTLTDSQWYDVRSGDGPLPIPQFGYEGVVSHAASGTFATPNIFRTDTYPWIKYGYRPQIHFAFEELLTSSGTGNFTKLPIGNNRIDGGIGLQSGQAGATGETFKSSRGYQHSAVRTTSHYLPEFTAVNRAITPGGDSSYVFVLQTIFENTTWDAVNELLLTNQINSADFTMTSPQDIMGAAVNHNKVSGSGYGLVYVISHSGKNWATGVAYGLYETVWSGKYIYTCISAHTSNTANDKPETGTNWATKWERKATDTHVRSNVLTEAQIQNLTGLDANRFMPEVGILSIAREPDEL